MKTIELLLVRHGETIWNKEKRMQGQKNSPLTPTGREQAYRLGQQLKQESISACFTSPSKRVQETLNLMSENLALKAQQIDDLAEIQMGTWEGQLQGSIAETSPIEWDNFWHHPAAFQAENGGETFADLSERCQNFLHTLRGENIGGKLLIISHRLTIKTIVNLLLNNELTALSQLEDIAPNSLTRISWDGQTATIKSYSDVSHYQH